MQGGIQLPRVPLVHGPTPLVKRRRLDEMLGVDLWIKRDDASGGAESGNKVRKLELLLGDALGRGADTVITCGALQSNHARATALSCASLGLACQLVLHVEDPTHTQLPLVGNVLLDRMAGAEIRLISTADYTHRTEIMADAAGRLCANGRVPYIVPEGGSNGLGSLSYVECMREVADQLPRRGVENGAPFFDVVTHACGSGGTAAGVALGASAYGVGRSVRSFAVSDDAEYFRATIERLVAEARALDPSLGAPVPLVVDDSARGPAYGAASPAQRATIVRVARASGLVLDPVYTGKAMHGLVEAIQRGDVPRGSRVLFVHTGGLPGLFAQGDTFAPALS